MVARFITRSAPGRMVRRSLAAQRQRRQRAQARRGDDVLRRWHHAVPRQVALQLLHHPMVQLQANGVPDGTFGWSPASMYTVGLGMSCNGLSTLQSQTLSQNASNRRDNYHPGPSSFAQLILMLSYYFEHWTACTPIRRTSWDCTLT